MRKRIVCMILCLALAFGFTGCTLFEHNYEGDYQQVIARIASIEEAPRDVLIKNADGTPKLDNEGREQFKQVAGKTEEQVIYKTELISAANAQLSSLVQQGASVQQAVETLYERLILQKLVINEADLMIQYEEIAWDDEGDDVWTVRNTVMRTIYDTLDAQLETLRNEILAERGEEVPTTDNSSSSSTSTTYPTPTVDEEEDEEVETEEWKPPVSRYPGLYGTIDRISLDNQAMTRLVRTLRDNVYNDFRVTATQKAEFDAEFKHIDELKDSKGMPEVYAYLGKTKIIDWVLGRTAKDNLKLTKLQTYLTEGVNVSATDVRDKFESLKTEQKASFDADASAYKTAITSTSSTTPIVYYPNANYFFVKHILIPFSDEQTAELNAFKNDKRNTKAEIEAFRARLAESITTYRHVDGEDDLSQGVYTLDEAYNDIVNTMARYEGKPYEAERKFDELIFTYNTDPGIFNNERGYALPYALSKGETDTYMAEFAAAARKMYEENNVGDVLHEKVVTDYGVHIMYLAGKTKSGFVNLSDYQTEGRFSSYEELIKDMLETSLQESKFTNWQQTRIAYYDKLDNVIVRYTDRFQDLYK